MITQRDINVQRHCSQKFLKKNNFKISTMIKLETIFANFTHSNNNKIEKNQHIFAQRTLTRQTQASFPDLQSSHPSPHVLTESTQQYIFTGWSQNHTISTDKRQVAFAWTHHVRSVHSATVYVTANFTMSQFPKNYTHPSIWRTTPLEPPHQLVIISYKPWLSPYSGRSNLVATYLTVMSQIPESNHTAFSTPGDFKFWLSLSLSLSLSETLSWKLKYRLRPEFNSTYVLTFHSEQP